jgi:hypothetical protein
MTWSIAAMIRMASSSAESEATTGPSAETERRDRGGENEQWVDENGIGLDHEFRGQAGGGIAQSGLAHQWRDQPGAGCVEAAGLNVDNIRDRRAVSAQVDMYIELSHYKGENSPPGSP